ncbi:RNA helicase [Bacilli bacterium]|nr:RNA helicase [Bacilli bacterium]
MSFSDFNLKQEIVKGIESAGYTSPTEIQQKIIPMVLNGKDVLAKAPTGTGKTAAFTIPTINNIDLSNSNAQVLVLSPTRELTMQISTEYTKIGQHLNGFNVVTLYGGQKIDIQFNQLRKKTHQVIVATPGRIVDHLERKTVDLSNVSVIILDEVDVMFDKSFLMTVKEIINHIKKDHQTVLLSATMNREITNISSKLQNNAEFVEVQKSEENKPNIKQYFIRTPENKKFSTLVNLINEKKFFLVIVFVNQKYKVKKIVANLKSLNFKTDGIQGDLKQNVRERIMKSARNGAYQVLVATDVAARGIDISDVDAVVNYDMPDDQEYYVHRIGRTGRAKRSGESFIFLSGHVEDSVRLIKRITNSEIDEFTPANNEVFAESYSDRGGDRFNRDRNSSFGNNRREGGFNRDRNSAPRENSNPRRTYENASRFFINAGFNDDLNKDSMRAEITKAGLTDGDIKDVYVKDAFSFVTIDNSKIDALKSIKEINGRDIKIEPATVKENNGSNTGGGFNRDRNSSFGNNRREGGFNKDRKSFGGHSSGGFNRDRNSGGFNRDRKSFGGGYSKDKHSSGGFNRDRRDKKGY